MFVLGVLVLWALIVAVPHYYNMPLRLDVTAPTGNVGIFAEEARTVANGALYRDLWSNKPPGMFIIMGLFVKALGANVTAIATSAVFMNIAFVVAVTALAYAISESWAATVVGGALALIISCNFRIPETTIPMAALGATAMTLALLGRGRWPWMIAAGLVFTFGALTKQPLMAEVPALLAFAAVRAPGNRRRKLLAPSLVLVGIALAVAAFALWAISNGSAQSMWFHVYSSVSQYVFRSDGEWHFSNEGLAIFQDDFLRGTLPFMLTLFLMAGVASLILLVKRRRDPLVWVAILWFLLAFGAASTPRGLSVAYYRQTAPAIVGLIALSVPLVQRMSFVPRTAFAGLLLVGSFWFGYRWIGLQSFDAQATSGAVDDQPVVDYIEQHTQPDDCLWMWGNNIYYSFLTERRSCVGASYEGYMMDSATFPVIAFRAEYMRDLFNHPPALQILYSSWGYFPQLQTFADRYLGPLVMTGAGSAVFTVDMAKFHHAQANFGGEIGLYGYDLPPKAAFCPGETLPVALTWERLATPTHQYQAFAQLVTLDESARVAGWDGVPAKEYPTNEWVDAHELILGPTFDLTIPKETKPGTYRLIAGLYDVATQDKLPALGADGQPNGSYARLQDVTIQAGCGVTGS